jgi:GxxExxY protein
MPEWDRARAIISAFYETYNALGYGYLESVYRNALAMELRDRGMDARAEMPIRVFYKERPVGDFRTDIIVDGRVIVELKAGSVLGPTDKRQLINYLKATSIDVGLLLHYGPNPKFQRLVSPRVLHASNDPFGSSR